MSITFREIENSVVILRKGGVYSQHVAYSRNDEVFAKMGSNYVGLRRHTTSKDGVMLEDYDLGSEHEFSHTATGRLVFRDHPHAEHDTEYFMKKPLGEPEEEISAKKKSSRAKK